MRRSITAHAPIAFVGVVLAFVLSQPTLASERSSSAQQTVPAAVSNAAAPHEASSADLALVLAPCETAQRDPNAPKELDQFAFLIGNYDVTSRRRNPDGTWSETVTEAYWEGRWILAGTAIADYWYDQKPIAGSNPGRGVNVRMYREDTRQWTNMWQHSAQAQVRTLISEVREDGLMHMWATHPDTSDRRRLRFETDPPNRWTRVEEWSQDQGKTWFEVARIDATRAACPWQP